MLVVFKFFFPTHDNSSYPFLQRKKLSFTTLILLLVHYFWRVKKFLGHKQMEISLGVQKVSICVWVRDSAATKLVFISFFFQEI